MTQFFLKGTGSSMGTPHPYYLLNSKGERNISVKAAEGDPRFNKNYRCNPSIVIKYRHDGSSLSKNIIVDVGKTFRESLIRWFPKHEISYLDAIILTHGHADAIFGLDDIRGVQHRHLAVPMQVYLSAECLDVVKKVFYYLFPTHDHHDIVRHVSTLAWTVIKPFEPFVTCKLEFTPIPGKNLILFILFHQIMHIILEIFTFIGPYLPN